MSIRPPAFDRLVAAPSRFPGLGPKSAVRLALWLVAQPEPLAGALGQAIAAAPRSVRSCPACFLLIDAAECPVCSDAGRDRASLCVVEQSEDAWRIDAAGCYHGLYHVLGGALSPLDGLGPAELRIAELEARVRANRPDFQEIILATDFDTEGNATALYLAERLAASGAKVTRPAHGLPAGAELSASSDQTLAHALTGRKRLDLAPRAGHP